ncbi:MAG: DUF1501 domain-containing protein [Bacteroidota bacterium]
MRHGSAIAHGQAHTKDHQKWSRRSFIRNVGITGGLSMFLGHLSLTTAAASPLSIALNDAETDRILVLIRLKGGNDGLNTIVPLYDYDRYRNLRPTLGFKENQITKINDAIGVPKMLDPLTPFWQEGQMKVIHGVGYPDQNLSHFRSSDLWASGQDETTFDGSGWYGRYIEQQFPDFMNNPPTIPPAIQIGGSANVTFNSKEMTNLAISVQNPEEIAEIAESGQLYSTANLPDCYYGEQVGFVRSVANNTFFYAGILSETYKAARNEVEYRGDLGAQLATVARLIKGNLGTKLYMVSIDGFDTHANQEDAHAALLEEVSNAVKDFYADLKKGGRAQDVLSMTFSEFGRRIEENGSKGTDHGAAAPMMFFGAGLNGNGFIGKRPDLQDVDQVGNLKFDTDFRAVYATVLENWLCVDGNIVDEVMGNSFARIDELGLSCNNQTTPIAEVFGQSMLHQARYGAGGRVSIYYELPENAQVNVQIINLLGQPVATLANERQSAGMYNLPFNQQRKPLAKGQYFYRIQVDGQVFSEAFVLR